MHRHFPEARTPLLFAEVLLAVSSEKFQFFNNRQRHVNVDTL
jgi:hypothetical protein